MLYLLNRIGLLAGWGFIFIGFACAATGGLVTSLAAEDSFYTSAYDLWYAVRPGSLVVSQIHIEKIAPWLWDPLLRSLLLPPAWLLFGAPGVALCWYCWPGRKRAGNEQRQPDEMEPGRFQDTENPVLLYEKLSESVDEETSVNDSDSDSANDSQSASLDDMAPNHQGHQRLSDDAKIPALTDDQLNAEINRVIDSKNIQT